jgi:recombination protein RecA
MAKKAAKEVVEEDKSIESALANLQKKYGANVVVKMDSEVGVEAVSTGCFALDAAFGCGGLPRGRIIEVFGQESSGKSTLAMFIMSQIQKAGGKAALIDAEYAFDASYAGSIGVDVQKLLVSQPETLEEAMDVIKELVETNQIDIIVVDSVASMVPKAEVEGDEMLKDTMAVQARLLNKALRILTGPISRSRTSVIFINQLREKIGIVYGAKEYTPGGKALKFYSSVRINVKKGEKIEDDGETIGNWMNCIMVKNKVGFPWKAAEFELYYSRGVDLFGDTLDYGTKVGVITKTGNSYSYKDKKRGVGREQGKKSLADDPKLYEIIRGEIAATFNENNKGKGE